jgi:Recombination, repair and ssDNA binding protein UvsY.
MNIEQLETQVDKDLYLDETILAKESLATPLKHNKYLKMVLRERLKLKKLKTELYRVSLGRTNYYNGNDPDPYEYVLKDREVKEYVKIDPMVVEADAKVALQEELVKYLDEVCKMFVIRGFAIKNALDVMKYHQGLV